MESLDKSAIYNYLPLREKPILRSEDDRAIILDPIFYNEKASIGPLFILTKNKTPGKANQVFGAFGKAFENYTCDIFKRMFPDINGKKQLLYKLEKEGQDKNKFEIDACVNKDRRSVIFEIKAVWIREDKILNEDYKDYLEHLREKYGVVEKSDGQKIKGVGQLARIINNISSNKFRTEDQDFNQLDEVYPVLLVYDTFLTAPVYGNFLGEEFEKLLKPDRKNASGDLIKNNLFIHPLIIMTIEDLENLEFSIKHFDFIQLLSDYSKACPDRLASLKNYIACSKYNRQMFYNKNLADKCLEIFSQTKTAMKNLVVKDS